MAITQVRAQFGGQWYTLTYNPAARAYQVTLTPGASSISQPGGYYNITVQAVNDTGVVATTDGGNLPGLRLVVRETVPPALTLVSPAAGYLTTNTPTITWNAVDNAGGSGIDPDSAVVELDGAAVPAGQVSVTAAAGGAYTIVYTPGAPLTEGAHTVTARVQDNDGNGAELSTGYIVDTVPPALETALAFPEVVVDAYTVELTGRTNDATAPPVAVAATDNGTVVGTPAVGTDGAFSLAIPLVVGENHITVTATDGAGLTTTESWYLIRLVTDRMQADVEARNERGTYNAADLNRVNTAMAYLNGWITAAGVTTQYADQGITWDMTDIPMAEHMAAYLANVEALRGVFPLPEAPETPESMALLTWTGANDIEMILVLIDRVRPRLERTQFYSNEIYCGEA